MIPRRVEFTGLTIDPLDLLIDRIEHGNIPTSWSRLRFEIQNYSDIYKIDRWMLQYDGLEGRWARYVVSFNSPKTFIVVMAFETDNDIVMFRLRGGEKAWQTEI